LGATSRPGRYPGPPTRDRRPVPTSVVPFPMRRLFPVFIATAAILAGLILFAFVKHGDTAHTQPVPEAGASAR
jgi:hypothetical protein